MGRRWCVAVVVVALAGCGDDGAPAADDACRDPAAITRAAGGDGSLLISGCVRSAAHAESDLQEVGSAVTQAADTLGEAGDAAALGFLIGALHRGASQYDVQAEMVHRAEVVARRIPDSQQAALRRGIARGEADG